MKKQNSELFAKFELKNSDLSGIVGGNYTASGSDTNMAGGASDVIYGTSNGEGGPVENDVAKTSLQGDTQDKPVITISN